MNIALLQLWRIWDHIYYHSTRLQYIDKNNNLFRIVLLPYWGNRLVTKSGHEINKNDLVIKLHIHNFRLAEMIYEKKGAKALGILLLREVRNSMPGLAQFVANHPMADRIKGIVGTTFLHRGVEKLGFTTSEPINTGIYRLKSLYLKWMMRLMHPDGKKRLESSAQEKLVIKRVFISKEELLDLYYK